MDVPTVKDVLEFLATLTETTSKIQEEMEEEKTLETLDFN